MVFEASALTHPLALYQLSEIAIFWHEGESVMGLLIFGWTIPLAFVFFAHGYYLRNYEIYNPGDNGLKTTKAMATFMDCDWKMLKAETALLMITSGHESQHCFTQVSVAPNAEPSVLSSWTPSTMSLCSSAMPHCTKHHRIVISDTNGPRQYCLHPQNCASN